MSVRIKWGETLKKSWEYLAKNRAIWYLGILAALTEGGTGGSFGSNSSWQSDNQDLSKYGGQAVNWITSHFWQLSVLMLAMFLISIVILYISYSARAGLIHSIDQAESSGKKPEFHRDFHFGQKFFWRFLGLTIIISLIILGVVLAAIILVGASMILVIAVSLWFLILAIPLALVCLLGIIAVCIYLNLILYLAYRAIVIENMRIVASINRAKELMHGNLPSVLLAWLIQLAINTALAIALAIVGIILVGSFFALGVGMYYAAGVLATWIYGTVAVAVLLAVVLAISGGFNAYFSTFWTLVYLKLSTKS